MPTPAETLLTAEEAIQNLLTSLGRLKGEVEGYAGAGRALDEVRNDLHGLIAQTAALAAASHAAVAELGRIGTPELLDRLDALRSLGEEGRAHVGRVQDECRQVAAAQQSQAKAIEAVAEGMERSTARMEGPLAALGRGQGTAVILLALALLLGVVNLGLSLAR